MKYITHLDSCLHGLPDRLAGDDAWGLESHPGPRLGGDWAGAVDGVAQGVHDATQQLVADGHVDDGAGPLDNVALLDELVVTEHDHADVVGLQVEGHALKAEAVIKTPDFRSGTKNILLFLILHLKYLRDN